MDALPPRSPWRVARPTASPLPAKVDGLLEEGVDAIPVRVTIEQDGVTTGWDDGAMGFDEDAVWFSGRACSFRIVAPDILPGAHLLSRHQAVADGEALRQGLPLRHPMRKVWLRVKVLNDPERNEWDDEAELIREVKRLRAHSESREESAYPPLSPRPGLLKPSPKQMSLEKKHRLRIVFGTGCVFALTSSHSLAAAHLLGKFPDYLSVLGTLLMLPAILGIGDPTTADQKALHRFADEEHGEALPEESP